DPKPKAFLQEPPIKISVCDDSFNRCHDAGFAVHAAWLGFRVQLIANFIPFAHRDNCDWLHCFGGAGEDNLLQEGQMLNHNSYSSADVVFRVEVQLYSIDPYRGFIDSRFEQFCTDAVPFIAIVSTSMALIRSAGFEDGQMRAK